MRLAEAERAVGRLSGVGTTLPNPYLLINPFIRREAVLSSRIEGTQASLSDLLFFEAAPSAPARVADVHEVANYVRALESGPGEFRRSQNWIGPPGSKLDDAIVVPPPVPEMNAALDSTTSSRPSTLSSTAMAGSGGC